MPDRPRGPRSGAAARSGPSGPTITPEQRHRRELRVTVAPETRDYLEALAQQEGTSPSRLVDEAVRLLARERAGHG